VSAIAVEREDDFRAESGFDLLNPILERGRFAGEK
jgi:hypothetical protein